MDKNNEQFAKEEQWIQKILVSVVNWDVNYNSNAYIIFSILLKKFKSKT